MKFILLFSFCSLLATCASYQQSVASRSVGAQGYATPTGNAGGKVVYTVTYR